MSKSRMAAGCYFQTGDGSNAVGTSAVMSLAAGGSPTAGTVQLNYPGGINLGVQAGQTFNIGSVSFNETAAQLQTLLDAALNIGKNAGGLSNALAGGGPWPTTPLTVTFQNDLANRVVPLMTFTNNTLTPSSTPVATFTTPGVTAGETFSNISELTTLPFPAVKRAKKEVTNFDSLNFTKEFIPEFIDPGDVKIDANYIGDATQDPNTGLIVKFNQGLVYTCQINVPNYVIGPGVYVKGHLERYKGFFTDAAIAPAKVADVLMISGTLGITGAVSYLAPIQ